MGVHKTFEIPMEFIENSIKIGIDIKKGEAKGITKNIESGTDLKRIYFVGQGLVLDTEDEFGDTDVITINWSDENFGSFMGGPRRLLSITALRDLKILMNLCKIKYTDKEFLCRV